MKKILSFGAVFFGFSLLANASRSNEYALGNATYLRIRVIESAQNPGLKRLAIVKYAGGGQNLGNFTSNESDLVIYDFNDRTHVLHYTINEDLGRHGVLANTYELDVDSMKVKLSQSRSAMINSNY